MLIQYTYTTVTKPYFNHIRPVNGDRNKLPGYISVFILANGIGDHIDFYRCIKEEETNEFLEGVFYYLFSFHNRAAGLAAI